MPAMRSANHDQTQTAENQNARDRAQIAAAASGQRESDITNRRGVSDEQFAPHRPAAPTNEANAENPEDFQQTCEVIGTDVEPACALPIISTLQKGDQHEIVATAEL